jgi:hypothetical protein
MLQFNYSKICQDIFSPLAPRQKEVLERRFGLSNGQRETLDSIGQNLGLTRERIRQIENEAFSKLEKEKEKKELERIFLHFKRYFERSGGFRKEDILLEDLGGEDFNRHVYFLLTLADDFWRISETDKFYTFWTIEKDSQSKIETLLDSLFEKFYKANKLFSEKDLFGKQEKEPQSLHTLLEIAKRIEQGQQGQFGLTDWPEIKPRGIKDKAYLVFKEEKNPLHFTKVAIFIGKETHPQTVHNELIRDPRFVLVGRGIYALKEWGYETGTVQDIILKVLKQERKPISKEKLLKKVQKQRLVKENTILLNLANGKYFSRDQKGRYILKNF